MVTIQAIHLIRYLTIAGSAPPTREHLETGRSASQETTFLLATLCATS
jgi:hypothetical protein